MKVFKLNKYHIAYKRWETYALCGRTRNITYVMTTKNNDMSSTLHGMNYSMEFEECEDYNEGKDICKTCQRMNFDRIVRKLKGK